MNANVRPSRLIALNQLWTAPMHGGIVLAREICSQLLVVQHGADRFAAAHVVEHAQVAATAPVDTPRTGSDRSHSAAAAESPLPHPGSPSPLDPRRLAPAGRLTPRASAPPRLARSRRCPAPACSRTPA